MHATKLEILGSCGLWLKPVYFCKMNSTENKVFIITGKQGGGKTNLLIKVIEMLGKSGLKMNGFVAKGHWNNGLRSGFDLQNISSGESKVLCKDSFEKSYLKIGRFYFNPDAIKYGEEILSDLNVHNNELKVIDEIGLFEIQGKLWSNSLTNLLMNKTNPILITVRINFLEEVVSHFNLTNVMLFNLAESSFDIADKIYKKLT